MDFRHGFWAVKGDAYFPGNCKNQKKPGKIAIQKWVGYRYSSDAIKSPFEPEALLSSTLAILTESQTRVQGFQRQQFGLFSTLVQNSDIQKVRSFSLKGSYSHS
jgi:hypothetical protein